MLFHAALHARSASCVLLCLCSLKCLWIFRGITTRFASSLPVHVKPIARRWRTAPFFLSLSSVLPLFREALGWIVEPVARLLMQDTAGSVVIE